MRDNLPNMLRAAAKEWRKENKVVATGATRYDAALDEAADAIEELSRREAPMKITGIHVDEYYCPACGAENNCDQGYVQDAYCPVCGQRLLQEEAT